MSICKLKMLVLPHLTWDEAKALWFILDKEQIQFLIYSYSFKVIIISANMFALNWKCLQIKREMIPRLIKMYMRTNGSIIHKFQSLGRIARPLHYATRHLLRTNLGGDTFRDPILFSCYDDNGFLQVPTD